MGLRPSAKHTLDRIDNDKGYYKENCRWTTWKVQQRNKSSNIIFTFSGIDKTLGEWAEILNIPYKVLRDRLKRYKWTAEEAFTTPLEREQRYLHFRWR